MTILSPQLGISPTATTGEKLMTGIVKTVCQNGSGVRILLPKITNSG